MIIRGDARGIPLRDKSVQCVTSSPPYWGLRDYGISGQIGLEPTPEAYVETMVGVFREVWRVLRDDGVVWLNLGDSYAGSWGNYGGQNRGHGSQRAITNGSQAVNPAYDGLEQWRPPTASAPGLKPKDLCGIPWRVAFALQADGWYLRSDIIWAKPNPMPESVTDRPTRSHEYIFLLSKNKRYYYDADAIREPLTRPDEFDRKTPAKFGGAHKHNGYGTRLHSGNPYVSAPEGGRNKRDVWTVNSEPTPEAHFATFPQKLIEPCILAGTSEKGCCKECGAPRVRKVRFEGGPPRGVDHRKRADFDENCKTAHVEGTVAGSALSRIYAKYGYPERITEGWQPSCTHDAPSVPCIVFDPFLGSGTVGKICERLGRRWVGLELSESYIEIAKKRTAQRGLFAQVDTSRRVG